MLNGRVQLVRVSLEAVKGTALAGATELWCYGPEVKRDDNAIQVEDAATGLGGPDDFLPGPATGTATLKTFLRPAAAGHALDAGILACLQACGLKSALGALTIAAEADQKTLTIDRYVGGLMKRLHAAAGNWQLTAEYGKPVELQFDFNGKYTGFATAALPVPAQNLAPPLRSESMTLTLADIGPAGGLKVSKLTLNANNPVEPREDLTATLGIGYYMIGAGRRYVVELDPEAAALADWNPEAIHEAGTTGELTVVLTDGTTTMTLTAPRVQLLPMGDGVRGSKLIYANWRAQCNHDA
ncbi:MAG: hypothetical protein GX591_02445, partial [Planctomycetes bacterium]|nr:hypothetical protein [Planctomycetota bacterium]